jgi:hypothetical protein
MEELTTENTEIAGGVRRDLVRELVKIFLPRSDTDETPIGSSFPRRLRADQFAGRTINGMAKFV